MSLESRAVEISGGLIGHLITHKIEKYINFGGFYNSHDKNTVTNTKRVM